MGGDKQAAQCGHSPRRTLVSTGCYKGSQPAVTALAAAESPVETPSEVLHSRDLVRANMSRSRLVPSMGLGGVSEHGSEWVECGHEDR